MLEIRVSDDEELIKRVRKAIIDNDGFCITKHEKIPENKCICKEFLETDKLGACDCGLYIKRS